MKGQLTREAICIYGVVLMVTLLSTGSDAAQNNKEEKMMKYEVLKKKITGVMVKNVEGKEVALESLWKERRIVLSFMRHFG